MKLLVFAALLASCHIGSAADALKLVRLGNPVGGHIHPAACVSAKGTLVVTYGHVNHRDLRLTRSTDGGASWTSLGAPHGDQTVIAFTANGTVLAGNGPLLWLLAAQILRAGGRIEAMLDTTPRRNWLMAAPHVPDFRVNRTLPLAADPPLSTTCAVSFGNQVWADVVAVVSLTMKHSVLLLSEEPRYGVLPPYSARKQ